jgi:hypothetical protein
MSCSVAKFTITKGVDNTFLFTIKADGSTLPMEITGTDTFVADLVPLDPEDTTTGLSAVPLTLPSNLLSGKVTLDIPESSTLALVSDKGAKTDRYYLRPTYKLIIECNTANNGNFIAKVPEVYVD